MCPHPFPAHKFWEITHLSRHYGAYWKFGVENSSLSKIFLFQTDMHVLDTSHIKIISSVLSKLYSDNFFVLSKVIY